MQGRFSKFMPPRFRRAWHSCPCPVDHRASRCSSPGLYHTPVGVLPMSFAHPAVAPVRRVAVSAAPFSSCAEVSSLAVPSSSVLHLRPWHHNQCRHPEQLAVVQSKRLEVHVSFPKGWSTLCFGRMCRCYLMSSLPILQQLKRELPSSKNILFKLIVCNFQLTTCSAGFFTNPSPLCTVTPIPCLVVLHSLTAFSAAQVHTCLHD